VDYLILVRQLRAYTCCTVVSPAFILSLEIAAIVVAGTMTGNEIAVAVFFHPRISRLEDAVHVRAAQTLASTLGTVMPFWYALTFLLSLVVTFVANTTWDTPRWLALGSAALFAVIIVYTVLLPAPLNSQIARWQPLRVFRAGFHLPPSSSELPHSTAPSTTKRFVALTP